MQRALRLLEAVGTHRDGAPAKQLAREAGLPLPTAYHLLRTLTHEGYLRRENGVFLFGDAAERLIEGGAVQNRRTAMTEHLERWRDAIGVPVYCAIYSEGEIELIAVADTPASPAVDEWAAFRETGHAHAIGQCLLRQLDAAEREDHLDRHPVQPLTRHSVRDRESLLERLRSTERTDPVIERQEYALGTICAAIPITVGTTVATMAISLPFDQQDRLLPAVEQLRAEVTDLLRSLVLSISI